MRTISLFMAAVAILAASLTLAGCGGTAAPGTTGAVPSVGAGEQDNTSLPIAPGDDLDRASSATFNCFFRDTVNEHSHGRWTVEDHSGNKEWELSNTCYSPPKSWICGGNYWNNEDDRLISNGFTVPDGTTLIKLAFYSRWSIAAGDFGRVDFSRDNGGSWTQVQAFTNGSNGSYPAWTKYTYFLPDNLSGADETWRIRFRFRSNSSGTDWGFGVDSVSVYRTNERFADDLDDLSAWTTLVPPGGYDASGGQTWTSLTSAGTVDAPILGKGGSGGFACPTNNETYSGYYCKALQLTNAINIPANTPFQVSCYTAGFSELSWDGLMLLYSLDDGATWLGASEGTWTNAFPYALAWYYGYINSDYMYAYTYNVASGQGAGYGGGTAWTKHVANVPAQATASQLKLRFWFGSDASSGYQPGICVDCVRVY